MADDKYLELLKQGQAAWRQWRQTEPDIVPDLSRADLSQWTLGGAHLTRVNLSWANLSGADLPGVNLSRAN
ncbi:MAG: pentapeptide repeat-containing protein, partial [Anaerolineae bacterium]|nr:pentapeptide repeat-containing protein [Anaerolineae bacterium]